MNAADLAPKHAAPAAGRYGPGAVITPAKVTGQGPEGGDAGFDLSEFTNVLRRRRSIIAACTVLGTIVSAAVIFQITPRYTAESSVVLDQRKTQVVDVQAVLSGLPFDAGVVRSEVETIKSPKMAERVVDKLNLTAIAEFNAGLRRPSLFQRFVSTVRSIFPASMPAATQDVPLDPQRTAVAAAARALGSRIEVSNDGRSYVLKIRVSSESPKLAADIANAYAAAYLDSQLDAKFEAVRRANAWLSDRLAELRSKVEEADRAVQAYKGANNLTQARGETMTAQQVAELNSQLTIAAAERAQKETTLKQIEDQYRAGGVAAVAPMMSSPLVQALRKQEADLLQQQAQLATRYLPAHPARINVEAQIKDARQKIDEEVRKVIQGMAGEAAAARAKEATLRQNLQSLQRVSAQQGQSEVQLRELERQSESYKLLYENFLNRFKQTTSQEDMQQPDARLVTAASVPSVPSYPRTVPLTVMSFAGSLLLGLFAALGVERLDNGFRTADQIEKTVQAATLGLVPDLSAGELPHDIVVDQPVCAYSEAIRTIRTALRYSDVDSPPKVVLVTSSLPEEGKSIFSLSLARSVAFSGARALLIDCDLRRPAVARRLGIDDSKGLLDLFDKNADFAGAIQVDAKSGLHILPCTGGTANPQDILGSRHMKALLEKFRSEYDFVVLDTPPVLAVSDALVLSHYADTSIFLIRWGRTPRPVVAGALNTLRRNGGNFAGTVLSRVNFERQATYGSGDAGFYYGYYGKHYSYYGETKAG
ncbi:MAG: GumC family protein [Gemmatimonas sp.]